MREKYKPAFNKFSRNPQLSQRISSTAPKECDEGELDRLFSAAYAEGVRPYNLFMEINGEEHIAKVPNCALLGEVITSSGNTVFANFVKELQSLSWIEHGHAQYHEKASGFALTATRSFPPISKHSSLPATMNNISVYSNRSSPSEEIIGPTWV